MGQGQGCQSQSPDDDVAPILQCDQTSETPHHQGEESQDQNLGQDSPEKAVVQLVRSIHIGHGGHYGRDLPKHVPYVEVHCRP